MQSFVFQNPVKIIFGNNSSDKVGENAKHLGKNALLVYGKDSIKKSGLYDRIVKQLKDNGIGFVEHGGVKSNPTLEHAREGVKKIKDNRLDFILAVGGGSVIDESKAIAAGAGSDVDIWDLVLGKEEVTSALPLGVVLTIPATGSEMNNGAVITNTETKMKLALINETMFPKFSILDPLLTYTIPEKYTAYSAVDMVSHLTESYFTCKGGWTPIQDGYVENLVKTIMKATEMVLEKPDDNEARSVLMWAGSLALNGLHSAGVGYYDFPCHTLEHPISAVYDIAHGAGLSIVTPAWMKFNMQDKMLKIAQFGKNVFGIEGEDNVKTAKEAIEKYVLWCRKIGSPVTFAEAGIKSPDVELLVKLTINSMDEQALADMPESMIRQVFSNCL